MVTFNKDIEKHSKQNCIGQKWISPQKLHVESFNLNIKSNSVWYNVKYCGRFGALWITQQKVDSIVERFDYNLLP